MLFLSVLTLTFINISSFSQPPGVHEANTNPLGIRLMRQVPREYTPGGMMEVVISIYCDAPDPNYPVTAIGLYEMLPSDWTFVSMRGINTEPPPIAPTPGTGGTLQFAWIVPPPFPCSFAYTVQIPDSASGVKIISGQVEYRTNGPRLVSSPEVTEINGVDRTPPVITLLGDNPLILTQGTPYIEPGWKAEDNADGDISARVQTSGFVNINTPGEYTITYTVRDNAGNNATATRIVKVVPRQTPTTPGQPTTPTGPVVVTSPGPTPSQPPIVPQPNTSTTSIPSPGQTPANLVTQGPKPEEVTFPRPDLPTPPPNIPPQSKPKGIAGGEELKPFKLPEGIKSGFSLPPNFQKNQIPTQLPPTKTNKEDIPPTATQIATSGPTAPNVVPTTSPIETHPSFSPPLGSVSSEKETSQENTTTILASPDKKNYLSLTFVSNLYHWWERKSPPEQKNLIGMCLVTLLLIVLCIFTGYTAYQGVSPQPRKKKSLPSK